MIQAAVTRFTPFLSLAMFSCALPQEKERAQSRVKSADDDAVTARIPPQAPKGSTEADQTPPRPGTGRVTRIMLGDLFQLQQENRALIFDVRPSFIYQLGHIPGAVNWPKASFDSLLAANEPKIAAARAAKKPVVLYCVDFACPDARAVATRLSERGHSVAVLEGGWDAWKTGGLPAE